MGCQVYKDSTRCAHYAPQRVLGKPLVLIAAAVFDFSILSCATTPPPSQVDPLTRTHCTLQIGEKIPNPTPLPEETKILVNWHLLNGSKVTSVGFRGWDFNRDGRYEMVDVLNEDGTLQARVYDFDGDGVIDDTTPVTGESR